MKGILFLLGIILLAPLVSASCADNCRGVYDASVVIAQKMADSNGYVWGLHPPGLDFSRQCFFRSENFSMTDADSTDPCGKINSDCHAGCQNSADFMGCYYSCLNPSFQQCCFETAKMKAQRELNSCLANCPDENATNGKITSDTGKPAPAGTKILKKGNASESDVVADTTFDDGDKITAGNNGPVVVSLNLSDGTKVQMVVAPDNVLKAWLLCNSLDDAFASSEHSSIRGTINGGGDFIFILPLFVLPVAAVVPPANCTPDVQCNSWSKCEGGKKERVCHDANSCAVGTDPENRTIERKSCEFNMQKIQERLGCNQALASSEHSSIRGTINGGGDFIFVIPPLAIGLPLLDVIIPPAEKPDFKFREESNGKHEVVYNVLSDKGVVAVKPLASFTEYYVWDQGDKVRIEVESGSVDILIEDGEPLVLSNGESAIASATSITREGGFGPGPEPNPGPLPPECCGTTTGLVLLAFAAFYSRK